ncbi:MAG: CotH kinase family protein [Deltaproteobacteria bacterium]|nr:CotH kinase family protein [Deltaproteobacteria bacterium]MBT6434218.1 CotH kinase family protein [Deltaproteobacteria bacterium]MBT6488135.1 CotH kinase family protein [Deltaproteobacteria bacterium]
MKNMKRALVLSLFSVLLLSACGEDSAGDSTSTTGAGETGNETSTEVNTNPNACDGDAVDLVRPDGWTTSTHCKGVPANYEQVFDDTVVHRIDITVTADNYQATMNDLESILGGGGGGGFGGLDDTPEPMYVPVTLQYNGLTWWNVGMRYKGNSSLHMGWGDGVRKLAFRFHFDKYEDDFPELKNQRFYGFKKMTFSNGFKDDSLIRDKMAANIFRAAGVPAAQGAFARVYVDFGEGPTYFGLYTMIEDPSDEMLETQFDDDSGNLYKPEGEGATWQRFVQEDFSKKTHEDEADFSDIIAALDALHASRTNDVQWRDGLEAVFDVNAFLRCLAVNQVIVNWDSYGMMDHNYFVYGDPSKGGKLVWFPWDLNEAMLSDGPGSSISNSIMLDSVNDDWPLIRYLLDDSVYRELYKDEVRAVLEGAFVTQTVHAQMDRYHSLITPYVVGPEAIEEEPYTFLRRASRFEEALTRFRDGLKPHVEDRYDEAWSQLDAD